MTARMMPGGPVAEAVFADLEGRIEKLIDVGHTPGLGTLLVGDDSASAGYIRMKQEKAAELGLASPHVHLPQDSTQDDVVAAVRELNDDPAVDALLFQYPAPPQIDFDAALMHVDPDKDVDGMHPTNVGRLALGIPGPTPCTPAGIEALLAHYEIPVAGQNVVIVGRGVTIGRPLSILLSQKRPTANAAVTLVHTGVPDWAEYVKRADILVAAAGVPGMIQPEHLTPGVTVVGARRPLRGPQAAARRRRVLRGGGGRDHPTGRRRRPDHHRHALPQRRRGRRAPSRLHPLRGGSR